MSGISTAAAMPLELKGRDQWVPWHIEIRNGEPTKVPLNTHTGARGSCTDASTWSACEPAVAFADKEKAAGVGFVFAPDDPFCGIDLDNCLDPETREIEPWAMKIVRALDSYTETSPSGRGLHIIVRAELPPGGNRKGKVEMYDRDRFFTMTGHQLPGTSARVEERQEELQRLHRQIFGKPGTDRASSNNHSGGGFTGDDRELIERATRAKNGEKFRRLWAGDRSGYASKSEADLALVSQLVFWTGGEEARIDNLFRSSGLYREKWDRSDYRDRTIRAALARSEFYRDESRPRYEDYAGEQSPNGGAPSKEAKDKSPDSFNLTDLGNAERFVADHGENVRYCYPWGKWLVWTGARWQRDEAGKIHRLAKQTVRGIYREAAAAEDDDRRKALAQHATRSEAEGKIKAMLELAKSELPVSPEELDADPCLLNVPNGTVDLRTEELRSHRREDLLTKMAGAEYQPSSEAPAWGSFLERVLPGEDLRGFVRRAAGYSATGDTSEQCMFINHGGGANGKSTFQEALGEALGEYAMRTPTEMLLAKRSSGIPNDVARLKGARFVTASETEEGRRLAESLVKDLTGQDTISARFMRAEWFDFKPSHKLWLSTNHKPEIRGTDNAIWRRIRLIPWEVTIPPAEQDRKLPAKLHAELPGILAWTVRGCAEWHREGLRAPEEVRQATREYRAEMDVLAAFIDDVCVTHPGATAPAKALYAAYTSWCEENGERAETQRRFGMRLTERGFSRSRGAQNTHIRLGIGLRAGSKPDPEPSGDPTQTKGHSEKSPQSSTNASDNSASGDLSDPKNGINTRKTPREDLTLNQGHLGHLGHLNSNQRRLTEDEARQVQKLITEGMLPALARAEVLGEGV